MTRAEAGGRLDRLVENAVSELSRSQVKKLTTERRVTVNGSPAKAGHALKAGELIEVEIPPPPEIIPVGETIPLNIVFEDEWLLVVDKAAGMVVHPGAGHKNGTLVNALLGRGTPLSVVGAPWRPGIVHRLDKGTSGLLVVAKTEDAHHSLSAALSRREFKRRYWGLLWGRLQPPRGRIVMSLARNPVDRRRMRVVTRGGREAVTQYEVRWEGNGLSAVTLTLETGRTHQIRAHFRHLGHPVFGDPEYGGRGRLGSVPPGVRPRFREALSVLARQALHAAHLGFDHPKTGKKLEFSSDLHQDIHHAGHVLGVPPDALSVALKEDR